MYLRHHCYGLQFAWMFLVFIWVGIAYRCLNCVRMCANAFWKTRSICRYRRCVLEPFDSSHERGITGLFQMKGTRKKRKRKRAVPSHMYCDCIVLWSGVVAIPCIWGNQILCCSARKTIVLFRTWGVCTVMVDYYVAIRCVWFSMIVWNHRLWY